MEKKADANICRMRPASGRTVLSAEAVRLVRHVMSVEECGGDAGNVLLKAFITPLPLPPAASSESKHPHPATSLPPQPRHRSKLRSCRKLPKTLPRRSHCIMA